MLPGGGFKGGAITEIASDRSDLVNRVSLSVAITCLKNHPDATVCYIDSGSSAPFHLVNEIMKQGSHSVGSTDERNSILARLELVEAMDMYHLVDLLQDIVVGGKLRRNFKMVIVDGMPAALKLITDRMGYVHAQALLVSFARSLKSVARITNCCAVVPNILIHRNIHNSCASAFQETSLSQPGMGQTWSFCVDTRIVIFTRDNTVIAELTKSSLTNEGSWSTASLAFDTISVHSLNS